MSWNTQRDRQFANASALRVEKFKKLLKHQYGFLANPDQSVWANLQDHLKQLSVHEYLSIPLNRSYHNLLFTLPPPPGIKSLLGLGSNFCIQSRSSFNNIQQTIDRYTHDVQRVFFWKNNEKSLLPDQKFNQYNSKLYFRSDWVFSIASKPIELALERFSSDI